jgi:hypothetical protein
VALGAAARVSQSAMTQLVGRFEREGGWCATPARKMRG